MEFEKTVDGRNIYSSMFKRQVLEEVREGVSPHELGCKYGIPVQNVIK